MCIHTCSMLCKDQRPNMHTATRKRKRLKSNHHHHHDETQRTQNPDPNPCGTGKCTREGGDTAAAAALLCSQRIGGKFKHMIFVSFTDYHPRCACTQQRTNTSVRLLFEVVCVCVCLRRLRATVATVFVIML